MGWFYCMKYQKVTNNPLEQKCSMHIGHYNKSCLNNTSLPGPRVTLTDENGTKFMECCRYLAIRTDKQLDEESWSLWAGGRPR